MLRSLREWRTGISRRASLTITPRSETDQTTVRLALSQQTETVPFAYVTEGVHFLSIDRYTR